MKLQKSHYTRYIGVDVSKDLLEIDDSAGQAPASLANHRETIVKSLVSSVGNPGDTLVVCEATGGYERKLVTVMHAFGISVIVANPRQVRDFANGHGILEKNDTIDAAVIRHFGQDLRNLTLAVPKSDDQEKHGALARRRKQLLDMINQEKNRLQQCERQTQKGRPGCRNEKAVDDPERHGTER